MPKNNKRMNTYMNEQDQARLREYAMMHGMPQARVVRDALELLYKVEQGGETLEARRDRLLQELTLVQVELNKKKE
jgi:hypothetical protein